MPSLDGQDYVILNSVSNVSKAIDVLHGYGRIHCLLDNDEAGRKAYWELEKEFAPYAGFRAFKERNIYGCNTNRVPFYEETPFHPDWLLKDLIKIFHPSLLDGYELRYYKKLSE